MILKEKIEELVLEEIRDTEIFIVNIEVGKGNKISILLDTFNGITIRECGKISRYILSCFDKDVEDFSLEVSSTGLSFPLIHLKQYQKNVGRKVEIVTIEDKKLEGNLISVNKQGIIIEFATKVKVDGKKRKEKRIEQQNLLFDTIKTTKVLPDFKRHK